MVAPALVRRLPGVQFEVQSPPAANALPPMDVAVFVGFATSGPLHTPVAVEDLSQFSAIFGADALLAWDPDRGEPVCAYLAPAVRAYFRQGGRRCWIVRVAGDTAQTNYLPIPGLAQVSADGAVITPAFAQARSQGSWSDSIQVGTALASQPIGVVWPPTAFPAVDLRLARPGDMAPGDLLRLTFDEGYVAMFPLQSVQPPALRSSSTFGSTVRVTAGTTLWFTTQPLASPPASPQEAILITPDSEDSTRSSSIPVLEWSFSEPITLTLAIPFASVPPGSLIRVDCGDEHLWLTVQDVSLAEGIGSPPGSAVRVTGQGLWQTPPPGLLPASTPRAEWITFTLYARQGAGQPVSLSDLGFHQDHPRFWGAVPTDVDLFRATLSGVTSPYADLWQSATEPRFPVAGWAPEDDSFYLPVAMASRPDQFYAPIVQRGAPLEWDGLTQFSAAPFLDPRLSRVGTTDLVAEADFLRFQSPDPMMSSLTKRSYLRGIHAALDLDEASIIAVPDAVHRGWYRTGDSPLLPPAPPTPIPHPDWWHFQDCQSPPSISSATEPQWGKFLRCSLRVIPRPTLQLAAGPDNVGTFTLLWSVPDGTDGGTGISYVVEEAAEAGFAGAAPVYSGPADHVTLYGRAPGDYYYHVRVEMNGDSSDWSDGLGLRVVAGDGWSLNDPIVYSAQALLSIQRALLRLCAARSDMTAVISLPEHYREDDALTHVTRLKSPVDPAFAGDVLPLDAGESRDFSYAALYHPWLVLSDAPGGTQANRLMPPDGALCGIMALRTLSRDAWISPANQAIAAALALDVPVARERWADLQAAQINLIRQEPHGFVSLSADTLSDDSDLRPINVRRLLILLRRMALRLGPNYVFEPNDAVFQRGVQRGLEAMLQQLFVRGAFAGDMPATAFQVIADSSINTPAGLDAGRFVVDIKVSPSLPMTFLTVRLVQTSDSTTVVEGG